MKTGQLMCYNTGHFICSQQIYIYYLTIDVVYNMLFTILSRAQVRMTTTHHLISQC